MQKYGLKILSILLFFSIVAYFLLPIWFIILVDFLSFSIFYSKSVEKYFFRVIPVSQLKEGDVLAVGRIDGLTKEQVAELKRKGGKVRIKDGIRYGFVFFLSLVVTLLYGSVIELAVKLV